MNSPIKNMLLIGSVFLFMLVAAASGLPTLDLSTDTPWLTAGGADTAVVTVQVNDDISRPAVVTLTSTLGTLAPSVVTTDERGVATTTFTAGTVSGTATITATIIAENSTQVNASVDQQIDHATPAGISYLSYPDEASVGSEVEIALTFSDRWGNMVDDANETETVTLSVGSPAGGAAFIADNSTADSVLLPVGPDGQVAAMLRLDTIAGENIVQITPPGVVGVCYLTITGVADGPPVSIEPAYTSASCRADGASTILIAYTLYDEYGNLCDETPLGITSSLGEATSVQTNSYGSVLLRYGPKNAPVDVTLTATAVEGTSLSVANTFSFISLDPANLALTASPLNMKSGDVDPFSTAAISAHITDESGNPPNEEVDVTFEIVNVDEHGYAWTTGPLFSNGLSTITQATGDDGIAEVSFIPGAFATSEDATGTCTVTATATLNGTSVFRSVDLIWRNYPSFSVSVSASPSTVLVDNETDVTISLTGDGWALSPAPADVVMCISRTPTMVGGNPETEMDIAKKSAKIFAGLMAERMDRLGLVSYSDEDVTLDIPLNSSYDAFCQVVDSFEPDLSGKNGPLKKSGKEFAQGIEMAISNLTENSVSSSRNRAVIAVLDDDWNLGNDKKDWEVTAKEHAIDAHVKIYVVLVDLTNGHSGTDKKLKEFAEDTGGAYIRITDGGCEGELREFYQIIMNDLKTTAFDTTLDASLADVTVNDVSVPGSNVLQYCYVDGVSTEITDQTGASTTRNEESNWIDGTSGYNIGTMEYGQNWTATLRFTFSQIGTVGLFTDGMSKIHFRNAAGTEYEQDLPPVYITVANLETTDVFGTSTLSIPTLDALGDNDTCEIAVNWTLDYAGAQSVRQNAEYQYSSDNIVWDNLWHTFDAVPPVDEDISGDYSAELETDGKNGYYRIRIHAWEVINGGAEAWRTTTYPVMIDDGRKIRMKLF